MGNVIRMDSVPRSALPSSFEDVRMEGFRRALKALDALKVCTMREKVVALENWVAAGLFTEAEADAVFDFEIRGRG